MIVKNEERSLAKCLESVKNLVNQIVIVDTGSTDKTIKLGNLLELISIILSGVMIFLWHETFQLILLIINGY